LRYLLNYWLQKAYKSLSILIEKMRDPKYSGELVVVEKLETANAPRHNLVARIKSGTRTSQLCYIQYGDNPELIDGEFVARLHGLFMKDPREHEMDVYARFVTEIIPENFNYLRSQDTVLYGAWEDRMHPGINVPALGRVNKFYMPDSLDAVLYVRKADGKVIPNMLRKRTRSVMKSGKKVMAVGDALIEYLELMLQDHNPTRARILLVHESLELKAALAEFDAMPLKWLKMQSIE